MKIEKINDNQIRCYLSSDDLKEHHIRLSELAYGTDKARILFQDMMKQAHLECGFDVDNIPIMVEAIPVSTDSIMLIITKVEDPEELDTRFSKFAPFKKDDSPVREKTPVGADQVLDLIGTLASLSQEIGSSDREDARSIPMGPIEADHSGSSDRPASPESIPGGERTKEKNRESADSDVDLLRCYRFANLDELSAAAKALSGFYNGANTLYKATAGSGYVLIVHRSGHSPQEFNKVCNILLEYAPGNAFSASGEAYFQEYGERIADNVLQMLSAV